MRISDVVQRVGVRASAIRYYERIGLLPPPSRLNGWRVYGPDILDRLTVIRFGLNAGFSLKELRLLFANFGSRRARKEAAQSKLQELRLRQQRLRITEDTLKAAKFCRCGTVRACVQRLQEVGAIG